MLDSMTGDGHRQRTDLAFADSRFDALVRNLLSRLGEHQARDLFESGLGYQNILYMAVLLSHLGYGERQPPLRVLLVEEPEAHLHPQLQNLLLRYLQDETVAGRQVIATSHSPQFASSADLERLVVITRQRKAARATAHRVAKIEMTDSERAHVRRFLDVTKASLFFARGVVLVEGVTEQLLLPEFARVLGRNLADAGVTIINVGGVAFRSFARLFNEGGLPMPCVIVTDGDPNDGIPGPPSPRAQSIIDLAGGAVTVEPSTVTFEWDLAASNPRNDRLLNVLCEVRPQRGAALRASTTDGAAWATEFRSALGRDAKAEFAQQLALDLDAELDKRNRQSNDTEPSTPTNPVIVVPEYLRRAIEAVTPAPAESPATT